MPIANEANSGARHPAVLTSDGNACGAPQPAVPALDSEILNAVRACNGYPALLSLIIVIIRTVVVVIIRPVDTILIIFIFIIVIVVFVLIAISLLVCIKAFG